jgi:hypothetical protein
MSKNQASDNQKKPHLFTRWQKLRAGLGQAAHRFKNSRMIASFTHRYRPQKNVNK